MVCGTVCWFSECTAVMRACSDSVITMLEAYAANFLSLDHANEGLPRLWDNWAQFSGIGTEHVLHHE